MSISVSGLLKVADKGLNIAAKHFPAVLGIVAIGAGVAAVITAGQETKAANEELSELEERTDAWNEYKKEEKEYKHDREVAIAMGMDPNDVYPPMVPDVPKVTPIDVGKFLLKRYPKTLILTTLSLGSGIGMFCILKHRIAVLTGEVALLRMREKMIADNIEHEYGPEAYNRVTSPVRVVEKAQGRKEAVTEVEDDSLSKFYNGVWMHECDWFASDDFDYSLMALREKDEQISAYFRTHSFLSQRKLFEILEVTTAVGERGLGWEDKDWSGLSFEAAADPHYEERFEHRTFYDKEGGATFRSAYIRFPRMSSDAIYVRM